MSDVVTALRAVSSSTGIATIAEMPLQGMITLRGDLSEAAVKKAATVTVPGDMPGPQAARMDGEKGVAWMSPNEALVLCPYAEVAAVLEKMTKAFGKAHALAVNVSDARACFRVRGPCAREVLAKLCPVDLSPAAFTAGMFRRTRMAQVPAALWLAGEDTIQIICFRSHARYVFDLLCVAAQSGSEVNVLNRKV
jgi:sarcosine oxidase subunit gamma